MKKFLVTSLSSLTLIGSLFTGTAAAAGAATYSLSPASGSYTVGSTVSVSIIENSATEAVNSVQADITYNTSSLQFVGFSAGAFSCPVSPSGNTGSLSIGCATFGTTLTGAQSVGTLTFNVVAPGTGSVSMAGSSIIGRASDATDIWNHASVGTNFNIAAQAAPAPQPVTQPAPVVRTTTPVAQTTAQPTDTVATPAPTTGVVEAASTKTYTVSVKVLDSKGNAVKGALVVLNGKTVTTDNAGKANFSNVKTGTYTVTASSKNLNASSSITLKDSTKTTQNFMVSLPKAKSRSIFGIVLGTTTSILIIGGGALYAARKRASKVASEVKKTVAKKTAKTSSRLAAAK